MQLQVATHQLQVQARKMVLGLLHMGTLQWQALGASTAALAVRCQEHSKQQELGGLQVCVFFEQSSVFASEVHDA
jgi:hypothetical protein